MPVLEYQYYVILTLFEYLFYNLQLLAYEMYHQALPGDCFDAGLFSTGPGTGHPGSRKDY